MNEKDRGGSPWGELTGVRPTKLFTKRLLEGASWEQVCAELAARGVSERCLALCRSAAGEAIRVKDSLDRKDVCLYVGIPFCPSRCSYCSFVTHSVKQAGKLIGPFLQMLCRETEYAGELMAGSGLRLRSVYMGGGTPTTLSALQLEEVLGWIRDAFRMEDVGEFTVEAGRPDTVDSEKFDVMRRAGVDRVSINPQSFSPRVLEAIGREHTPEQVYEAFEAAKAAGFRSVNMDLIAGLPEDTFEGFTDSVKRARDLGAQNITVHTLAVKRGSRMNLEKAAIPEGEPVARMLESAADILTGAGYRPYYLYRQKRTAGGLENVGWSLPGYESIYNICIMEEFCGILSLGGGGVTKMVDPDTGYITRVTNPKYPYEYNVQEEKVLRGKREFFSFYADLFGGA